MEIECGIILMLLNPVVRYQAWVDERVGLSRCTPRDVNRKLLSVI